ncbi:MAG TPA: 6-bladed beta-propeller [bacterium]|nr:6-bladed beta-propeller [bacterium]
MIDNAYLKFFIFITAFAIFSLGFLSPQKVETIDGVRIVHNAKQGKWGKTPAVSLEFIRTIGDIESQNEPFLFHMPSDIILDSSDNIYIVDSGNHRIQKFKPDLTFIKTIGQRGEGPGEFNYPQSIDMDREGNIYVTDIGSRRIQILDTDGHETATIKMPDVSVGVVCAFIPEKLLMTEGEGFGMPLQNLEGKQEVSKMFKTIDKNGKILNEFGDKINLDDLILNRSANRFFYTTDSSHNVYAAFNTQNRLEKYSPEGQLLWRADRELDYSTELPKKKTKFERDGGRIAIREPQLNRCTSGIAVDDQGRIWVVTFKRQLREEERIQTRVGMTMTQGGQRSISLDMEGNTDTRETDAYQLEVYDQEGILLGKIPVDHFVDNIRIFGDRLFLLDKGRGMQFYEYRIKNN